MNSRSVFFLFFFFALNSLHRHVRSSNHDLGLFGESDVKATLRTGVGSGLASILLTIIVLYRLQIFLTVNSIYEVLYSKYRQTFCLVVTGTSDYIRRVINVSTVISPTHPCPADSKLFRNLALQISDLKMLRKVVSPRKGLSLTLNQYKQIKNI